MPIHDNSSEFDEYFGKILEQLRFERIVFITKMLANICACKKYANKAETKNFESSTYKIRNESKN